MRRPGVGIAPPSARLWRACTSPAADFPTDARRTPFASPGWRPLFEAAERDADTVAPGLAARDRAGARTSWRIVGRSDLPSGVIHADLFTDNVFFLGDAVSGLIDFYFACTDVLAYDLAICLNAWCFEPDGSFNVTKGRAMIAGYERCAASMRRKSRRCRSCAAARRCASC